MDARLGFRLISTNPVAPSLASERLAVASEQRARSAILRSRMLATPTPLSYVAPLATAV